MFVPITEHDYLCSDMLEGFKIWIHSAEEVPRLKKNFYHAAYDSDVRISVKANLMMTSPSLIKNYSQEQRKCIAENEHNLVFFKRYTQRNCFVDTLALQTNKICGCVLFWMPRLNSTKVCSYYTEYKCVEVVENSLHNANLTTKCLPDCQSITYDAEISMSRIELKPLKNFVPTGFRIIKITVLFKDQQYFASLRSELYGTMDFMGTVGGILSLFMGISLLSVVEIIYFATIRLTCNLQKRNLAKKRMLAQQNILNRQND
ncbi:pickpocket protein 28-like [Sitodiplosis mosellana]|uniref:pickpocket protein 28-like n=1 Tax=Sitodiplosis mosellana TaxID=263140 RepID=UPI0024438180|nr:pickpocket protein 28-like [Sitodiplosis mosellana]